MSNVEVGERFDTESSELSYVREGCVGQRGRARAAHGARHVGDAIMYYLVDDVRRLGMGSRARGFHTTSLVDTHVDDDSAFRHLPEHRAGDQLRRFAPA